jgi:hypothetical protein
MLYGTCRGGVDDPRPFMDQMMQEGAEYGRFFSGEIEPLSGRPQQQSAAQGAERIVPFGQLLQERNMCGQSVFITDSLFGKFNLLKQVIACATAVSLCPNLWGEVENEIGHPSQVKTEWGQLFDLAQEARRIMSTPLGLGADMAGDELNKPPEQGGVYEPVVRRFARMLAMVHLNRDKKPEWKEVCRLNELRIIMEHHNCAGVNNEMGRADHPSVQRPNTYAYLAGIISHMGFATLFHSSNTRDCRVLAGAELEAFRYFIRGGKLLPKGRYEFYNARWGGSPVAGAAFVDGGDLPGQTIWRTHSFRHVRTGQWYLVVCGPDVRNPERDIKFNPGFRIDKEIDRVDGQHVAVYTLTS